VDDSFLNLEHFLTFYKTGRLAHCTSRECTSKGNSSDFGFLSARLLSTSF